MIASLEPTGVDGIQSRTLPGLQKGSRREASEGVRFGDSEEANTVCHNSPFGCI
jgi:hypothetical protein